MDGLADLLVSVHTEMQSLSEEEQLESDESDSPSSSTDEKYHGMCISLSPQTISSMIDRGMHLLTGISRKTPSTVLPYDWPVWSEDELVQRITKLSWTNSQELDAVIRQILLTSSCLKSFHKAIHCITLMFWSDEEMRRGYLPRKIAPSVSTDSGHGSSSSSSTTRSKKKKSSLRRDFRQFYRIFMMIFDIHEEEEFDSCRLTKWIGDTAATCRHRSLVYHVQ
jgi:hypothetical protein